MHFLIFEIRKIWSFHPVGIWHFLSKYISISLINIYFIISINLSIYLMIIYFRSRARSIIAQYKQYIQYFRNEYFYLLLFTRDGNPSNFWDRFVFGFLQKSVKKNTDFHILGILADSDLKKYVFNFSFLYLCSSFSPISSPYYSVHF